MIYTYLFISALAVYCAWDDANEIKNDEKILHLLQWCIRFLVAVGMVAVVAGFGLKATFLAIGSGASFSMVFRYCLNRMRGLDWRYVSPSSWYDWQFIRHSLDWINKGSGYRGRVLEEHQSSYFSGNFPAYVRCIHRAGLVAYVLELVVLVGCSYLSNVL